MKIITNDYGCGTSSAFLDYDLKDVVVCSENNFKHVLEIPTDEDLFFVGHEFLLYLWERKSLREHWKNHKGRKIIWCFEKIDCIVPAWQEKSHYSLELCQEFTNEFVCSDEVDCRKYGIQWLPQWASPRFFEKSSEIEITEPRLTFSGQAGVIGYEKRDELLRRIAYDKDLQNRFYISNVTRNRSWDEYINNFLKHQYILAPFGNLKAFNTRTFEAITSGRLLFQQVDTEDYKWHIKLLDGVKNVKFFTDFDSLKKLLLENNWYDCIPTIEEQKQIYEKHNVYARFDSIGLKIG